MEGGVSEAIRISCAKNGTLSRTQAGRFICIDIGRSFLGETQHHTPIPRVARVSETNTLRFRGVGNGRAAVSRLRSHLILSSSSWALRDGNSRGYMFNIALHMAQGVARLPDRELFRF